MYHRSPFARHIGGVLKVDSYVQTVVEDETDEWHIEQSLITLAPTEVAPLIATDNAEGDEDTDNAEDIMCSHATDHDENETSVKLRIKKINKMLVTQWNHYMARYQ